MLLEIARAKIDAFKEIIPAWGPNPEEILTREALTQPHRAIIKLTNAF